MAKARKPKKSGKPSNKQRFNLAVSQFMRGGTPRRQAERQAREYLASNP